MPRTAPSPAAVPWRGGRGPEPASSRPRASHLRWVRKLPLAWPDPSQPGVGQVGPSFFSDFQENEGPLTEPSFCLRVASGQPDALR